MSEEIPKIYEPGLYEKKTYEKWLAADAFAAVPDGRARRYVIMMPLPNVTGALHMGHAMDNVMQDLLTRWHRMMGDNTLWMPGTDHAGIGTQAVVEKRLFELEGKTRHDLGREGLVARIQAWKDEYRERIIRQQQAMGCSCDWKRQRFTMDPVCARAVREAFFRLFRDGLIYRGNRLVNWDCQLQTAVSDDEIVYEKVQGHFWHIKYPIIDPKAGRARLRGRGHHPARDDARATRRWPSTPTPRARSTGKPPICETRMDDSVQEGPGRPGEGSGADRGAQGRSPAPPAAASRHGSPGPPGPPAARRPAHPAHPGRVGRSRRWARAASRSPRPTTPTTTPSGSATRPRSGSSTSSTPTARINAAGGPYAGHRPLRGPQARRARPQGQGPARVRRGPRDRDRPLRPLQDAHRALPEPSSGSSA